MYRYAAGYLCIDVIFNLDPREMASLLLYYFNLNIEYFQSRLFNDLTPFIPLPLLRRGGRILERGLAPLLDASLTYSVLEEGEKELCPSPNRLSLHIKGIGYGDRLPIISAEIKEMDRLVRLLP